MNLKTNIYPKEVTLKIQTVEFDDLWKIRGPITEVEGFEIVPFNDLVQVMNISFDTVLFIIVL